MRTRALVSSDELEMNDQSKRERGVEQIVMMADLVLDNNGTVAASMECLLRHTSTLGIIIGHDLCSRDHKNL